LRHEPAFWTRTRGITSTFDANELAERESPMILNRFVSQQTFWSRDSDISLTSKRDFNESAAAVNLTTRLMRGHLMCGLGHGAELLSARRSFLFPSVGDQQTLHVELSLRASLQQEISHNQAGQTEPWRCWLHTCSTSSRVPFHSCRWTGGQAMAHYQIMHLSLHVNLSHRI